MIHASTIDVRLIRPRISGRLLLHDDATQTVVPVEVSPTDAEPWFCVGPPPGDTYRDDFDDYRHHAERIMRTLLAHTGEEIRERDPIVAHIGALQAAARTHRDQNEQDARWRALPGTCGSDDMDTTALIRFHTRRRPAEPAETPPEKPLTRRKDDDA